MYNCLVLQLKFLHFLQQQVVLLLWHNLLFFFFKSFLWQTLGFGKFSLLGWSDGGITALVAAARNPDLINKMVVWGANAFVSQQDLKLYNGVSRFIALDKWQVIRATNWLSLEYVRVVCLCVNGYVVGTLRGAWCLQMECEDEATHGGGVWGASLC